VNPPFAAFECRGYQQNLAAKNGAPVVSFPEPLTLILMIGHGPATLSVFGRIVIFILGVLFAVGAFHRDTQLRAAFSFGKGPGVQIGSAGRVILFLIALVLLLRAAGVLK
jgi:hypothetical protein